MKALEESLATVLLITACQGLVTAQTTLAGADREILEPPVRLEADGQPIDIGRLSKFAHAGPWLEDVDGDGLRDLLVGDFPGCFWLFSNRGTDARPVFKEKGKLSAGGEEAKTPVY